MLKHLHLENYRCFPEVDVPLRPLTVLVGSNDSGKSSFLSSLRHLTLGSPFEASDFWRKDTSAQIVIEGRTSSGASHMRRSDEAGSSSVPSIMPLQLYRLPPQGIPMESQGSSDEAGPPTLEEDGSGVPGLLDYFLRRERPRFFDLVGVMRRLVPGFEDLHVGTPDASKRRVEVVIEHNLRLRLDEASSGVRLLLFFVALAYHPTPPKTILVEEPENGIHPKRLADVIHLLREVSQGKHGGNAAQIIMTTHSPYLLDLIDLSTDQVLVFRREEDGSRAIEPADADRLESFLDEFKLGEVWYNRGEEGLTKRPA